MFLRIYAVAYAFGAFKYLEACKNGLLPNVSDAEFLSKIRHFRNENEIIYVFKVP